MAAPAFFLPCAFAAGATDAGADGGAEAGAGLFGGSNSWPFLAFLVFFSDAEQLA